jgi:hypothetical protein
MPSFKQINLWLSFIYYPFDIRAVAIEDKAYQEDD